MSVNPNFGVNPDLGVDAGLGTSEARAMRERLAARRAEREAAPVRHGESDLLFKIRELQLRCLKLEARNPADLLPRRYSLATGGGGGGSGVTPFKLVKSGALSVTITPGTVYISKAPTIGGTSIFATPAPTLATTESGFVVMRATWPDDIVPRCVPSSVVIEFEAGDPDADYAPPSADTRTSSRMAFGRVWVADGAITRVYSELSRNVVMERQIYDTGSGDIKFIAFGR